MSTAGYAVRETDPFTDRPAVALSFRESSPYVNRIRILWRKMRDPVIESFPEAPGLPRNRAAYMKRVERAYVTDAWHSLSIEGYRVTPELIRRVRSGTWNPDANEQYREQRNAMAARGCWQAFQLVQKSISKVLKGDNPGTVADDGHRAWYREMFPPSVTVGLLRPSDVAGYRNGHVFIRQSMHVPLNRDAMPALFGLLREEEHPAVRVVLGHFVFVYIHPYMDGNGRMGTLHNECHDGGGRLPVDGHTALRTQQLHGRSREGQGRRGHRAFRRISSRARQEETCRRTAAAGAEGVAPPARGVD